MNYWCEDLHLRYFRESRKRHYSLSLLLLYQINVLTISYLYQINVSNSYHLWLQVIINLEKRRKSNKFNRLQIEVLLLSNISQIPCTPQIRAPPHPEYRPTKFVLCPYIRPGCINGILRYLKLTIADKKKKKKKKKIRSLLESIWPGMLKNSQLPSP